MSKKLNRIKCAKCNTICTSRHRYDFVTCKCGAVSCDGGNCYQKVVGDLENILVFKNRKWVKLEFENYIKPEDKILDEKDTCGNNVEEEMELNLDLMDHIIIGCGEPRPETGLASFKSVDGILKNYDSNTKLLLHSYNKIGIIQKICNWFKRVR